MRRKTIVVSASAIVLTATAAAVTWHWMTGPLYKPGHVAAGRSLWNPLTPPDQSADAARWRVEPDIQLHHFAGGTGRRVLVVHGGPGYAFAAPIKALDPLTTRYRFEYYDQRGCGRSTRPVDTFGSSNFYANMQELDGVLGLGAQVADIERIRRLLGEEKLIILGHSFGAFLASMYAAEFPQRVEAMILVSPADLLVFPVPGGGLFATIAERLPESRRAEYSAFQARYLDFSDVFSKSEGDLRRLNAEFARFYLAAAGRPDTVEPADAPGWMVQAMYLSMGRHHDYRSALRQVRCRVLVVHGKDDLQSEDASRAYAEAFPNSRFRTVAEAGHDVFDDQPERFAELVGEFLAIR